MKHIFIIDPLENLVTAKDSSLFIAAEMSQHCETYVLFDKDLGFATGSNRYRVFEFSYQVDDYKVTKFELGESKRLSFDESCTLHMRLDPPVDTRYLQCLWKLKAWQDRGVRVVNSAAGILAHNEKLTAYTLPNAIPTYVGSDPDALEDFLQVLPSSYFILKPMDLYQGIGVEKIAVGDSERHQKFFEAREKYGTLIVQPFIEAVSEGEIRSTWFDGEEIGSILKIPPEGSHLANIAQGASFHSIDLDAGVRSSCQQVADQLALHGIRWIAFDILGGQISEVNLTCPGLLVETSQALGANLASSIVRKLL